MTEESHDAALFSPKFVSPVDCVNEMTRPVLTNVNDNTGRLSKIIESGTPVDKECIQIHRLKYSKIVQSSTDIANRISISSLDKHFDNIEMLSRALDASCVFVISGLHACDS